MTSAARTAGLPYGFTVTVWSSGQVLIHFHGVPGLGLISLFAAGAVAGYGSLRLVIGSASPTTDSQFGAGTAPLRAIAIQAAAVALSVGVVGLGGWHLPPGLCWPLGGAASVIVYLGVTGVECALNIRDDGTR